MKTKLLLLAVSAAAFSSCSTMYKTGQTPDDVYYSPIRPYVDGQEENKDKKEEVRNDQVNYYNTDDRLIRMGILNSRWRYLNNDYDYSPYYHTYYNSQSYYNGFTYTTNYNSYNKFHYNDYYYNPYYSPSPVYITNVAPVKNSTPRMTNLNGYGKNHNNSNLPLTYIPGDKPAVRSAGSKLGRIIENVLSPAPTQSFKQFNQSNTSNRNTTNNSTTTERTYTPPPSSSSSSSSSGSSSSGGRISRN